MLRQGKSLVLRHWGKTEKEEREKRETKKGMNFSNTCLWTRLVRRCLRGSGGRGAPAVSRGLWCEHSLHSGRSDSAPGDNTNNFILK
jgi:hypothetical protein